MKKIVALIVLALFASVAVVGCGETPSTGKPAAGTKK